MTARESRRPGEGAAADGALNTFSLPLTAAAVEVYRAGATPLPLVPGSKRPTDAAWQRTTHADEAAVIEAFTGRGLLASCGLGVRLGDGLADVDLDTGLARAAAARLLPATPARSGRASAQAGHYWYRLSEGSAGDRYVKYTDGSGGTVVELRADDRHQTAVAPTVHPSGEAYRWEAGSGLADASSVAGDTLAAAVASVALTAILAAAWPSEGSRHDAYLALAGALRDADGHEALRSAVEGIVATLAHLTGDGAARVSECVPTTLRRLAAGDLARGWTALGALLTAREGADAAATVKAAQRAADDLRAALGVPAFTGPTITLDLTGLEAAAADTDRWAAGGAFVFDGADRVATIWGNGDVVPWAEGESLMLYGPIGVGKSTLAGLLLRARLGLAAEVLGLPVAAGAGKVLYLAMDRPRQLARALRRQFAQSERAALDDRLVVRRGPLPARLVTEPTLLRDMAREAGADTVIVDSLKDAAMKLADDEGGQAYNTARQHALADGIELIELHHPRKAGAEGRKRLTLDDLYGSTWIGAGAGGVVVLDGSPESDAVEVYSVKSAEGLLSVRAVIDRRAGTLTPDEGAEEPLTVRVMDALTAQRGVAIAANDLARSLLHSEARADAERVRRELQQLADVGAVERVELPPSGRGGRPRVGYRAHLEG